MARTSVELALVLASFLLSGHAAAQRSHTHRALLQKPSEFIKSVVVLGDSVSDVGLPNGVWAYDNQTYPYTQFGYDNGRYSNGPVWIEYLCADYNLSQVNYAVGGATVNAEPGRVSLATQLQKALAYLQNNTLPSPSLGVIAIGANDLVDLGDFPNIASNTTAVLQWANNVIAASADAAQALLDAGVDKIVFVPTFDALKSAPLVGLLSFANPALKQLLYNLVYIMNKQMSAAVARLNGASSATRVYYVDAGPDLLRVNAHPERYGLREGRANCLSFNPPGIGTQTVNGVIQPATLVSRCSDPNSYFFWDILHPTTAGHRVVANIVGSKLRKAKLLP